MPGIKKLVKGELSNIDKGIPNNFPVGDIINTAPPNIALNPRNANRMNKIFRVAFIVLLFRFVYLEYSFWLLHSRITQGSFTPGPHRTVLEILASHGSSCSITNVLIRS